MRLPASRPLVSKKMIAGHILRVSVFWENAARPKKAVVEYQP
jgi:hypothetical protein